MTQEETKAYEEAYKRVAIRFGSNVADELFPELAESNDEKIRKALIDYFNDAKKADVWCNGLHPDVILTWLASLKERIGR